MAELAQLKNLGMMQNPYMWNIEIPVIPFIGENNFVFQARSSTIPGKTRNKNIIRYLGKQYTQPAAVEYDGEFTVTIMMPEQHVLYNQLILWHQLIDTTATGLAVQAIKTKIYIRLLSLGNNVITKRFLLDGAYVLGIPEIGGLDVTAGDGTIEYDVTFAYDDIDYDPTDALSF